VMILDPACGTGTFLLWIFQEIYRKFQENPELLTVGLEDQSWSGYVKERLLPRIFGFELLMAPYAIAHLKLGLFLEETGYRFDSGKRLGVFLTNTLEESARKSETLFEEFIAEEANQAVDIKIRLPIMLVIGNPPYSYESSNTDPWISNLVRDYYEVDGQLLNERNPKGLQDDYVKFLRFSQWRIDNTGHGILAMITNHGYLDNPTFRGMRQSLIETFDEISALNLQGNSKKQRVGLNNLKDENVFDIQQGVSIGFFVKESLTLKQESKIRYLELLESRENKYCWLSTNDISRTNWQTIQPRSPFYLLLPQNIEFLPEYEQAWKITEIFNVNNVSIMTARDSLTIQWDEESIWNTVNHFSNLSSEDARAYYELVQDTRDWLVDAAQKDIRKTGISKDKITPILYRPFDTRYTYYTGTWKGFHSLPRTDVMQHMLLGKNLGFLACRQISSEQWQHVLVSNCITDNSLISNKTKERSYLFPLYIYSDKSGAQTTILEGQCRQNFSAKFMSLISSRIGYQRKAG